MKRQLKVIASLALFSIAVYVLAQVQVVNRGGQGPSVGRTDAQATGGAVASRADGTPQSSAVYAMRKHIAGQINILRLQAKAAGRTSEAERLLEVSCWAVLASMTPEQQRYEIDHVWRLSHYKPSGEWAHVAAAPSMVSDLLKVSSTVNTKIAALAKAGSDRRMIPYKEFDARLRQHAKQTGQDFNRIHNEHLRDFHFELAKGIAFKMGRTSIPTNYDEVLALLAVAAAKDNASDISKIRSLLTPAQQAEWSRIEKACLDKAAIAANGGNPFQATGN